MDEGTCVYFGPWNTEAQTLLGKYLPASHLLAAAGNAEQPREAKKKVEKKEEKKADKVSCQGAGTGQWLVAGRHDCLVAHWGPPSLLWASLACPAAHAPAGRGFQEQGPLRFRPPARRHHVRAGS